MLALLANSHGSLRKFIGAVLEGDKITMFPTSTAMAEKRFRPGEQVPVSGVYAVVHTEHRPQHEVTLLENEMFPRCSACGEQVRFQLVRQAATIAADADFLGQ